MRPWYFDYPVSKITELLYVGTVNYGKLLAFNGNPLGIQAVLNVTSDEPSYDHDPEIQYCDIPFNDGAEIPEDSFARCMGYLKFQHDLGRKTFVHCSAGISRSPSIVGSFMHFSKQLDFDRAMLHIKVCREIVSPFPLITRSCKKHLRLWPYDGSFDETKIAPTRFIQSMTANQFQELIKNHPDATCKVRLAFDEVTSDPAPLDGQAMHEILTCTCKK